MRITTSTKKKHLRPQYQWGKKAECYEIIISNNQNSSNGTYKQDKRVVSVAHYADAYGEVGAQHQVVTMWNTARHLSPNLLQISWSHMTPTLV